MTKNVRIPKRSIAAWQQGPMISLIVKIFLAYWLAAGVVIFVVNIGPHKHMHVAELTDALDASLTRNAQFVIKGYLAGGCPSGIQFQGAYHDQVALATADGQLLCGSVDTSDIKALTASAAHSGKMTTVSHSTYQVIAFPTIGQDQKHYIYILLNHYRPSPQFFGTLPGKITISISLMVTLFLSILIALPIRHVRAAAHQIALGQLSARVSDGFLSRYAPFSAANDDLDGLAIDFNFMAARIEALVNSQRLLLRDVSHELCSPLARVNVALELARATSGDTARNYLDRIEAETAKLDDLISQLMELSYMEMTNQLAHPEEFGLSLIVLDLLPDLQFEAAAKGCRITATVAEVCRARGDRKLLHRAIENVARNAIRYTPAGGSVAIDLAAEESAGSSQAVFKVSDTGPGVPEDALDAILTPFYRVDQSRQSGSGGFGIGLAIADRAIQLHNGELRVKNGSGGGLIVEMRIPVIGLES